MSRVWRWTRILFGMESHGWVHFMIAAGVLPVAVAETMTQEW